MELFRLFGTILVDNDKANESLYKTEERTKELSDKFVKGVKTIGEWGAKLGAVAVAGASALGVVLNNTVEATAEINKFSQVAGFTSDEFQRWDNVMKSYGYSMEQASGDLAALAEKALDASQGAGEGAELFEKLGITVTDTSGALKTQEQLFNETITALQGMEDVTARNAIASALLSTTGEELVPVLNMTNTELANMKANSNVIPQDQIDKATNLKLKMDELKNALSTTASTILLELLPYAESAINFIYENLPIAVEHFNSFKEKINEVVDWIMSFDEWMLKNKDTLELVAIAVGALTTAVIAFNAKTILETAYIYALIVAEQAHTVATTIATTATTAFGTAVAFLTSPITLAILAIGALVAIGVTLYKNWDEVKAKATTIWNGIKTAITKPIEEAKEKIRGIIETIKGFFSGMKISIPKIPMPHFSVRPSGWGIGDLLKGKIPTLGISWYEKAMDKAHILDGAQVFGFQNGSFLGGGEAGREIVMGEDYFAKQLRQASGDVNGELVNLLNETKKVLLRMEKKMDRAVVLDSGVLVGELLGEIDNGLGNEAMLKARGVK